MKTRRSQRPRLTFYTSAIAATALLSLAAAPAQAVVPEGKYYLVALLFDNPLDGGPDSELVCLRFQQGVACEVSGEGLGTCGTWQFVELQGQQNRWQGEIEVEISGVPVTLEGNGLTERKGLKSSIGGAMYMAGPNQNAGFAGIQLRRGPCVELAASDDG